MRWYIVQAFSGFEKQVQRSLIERINRSEYKESFGQVLVPTEEVIEMRDGKNANLSVILPRLRIDWNGYERQTHGT